MFGPFALVAAALFAGAAIYVSVSEHPARLSLDDRSAVDEFNTSYPPAALMQASLALIGTVLGVLEWMMTGRVIWLMGALILFANVPYTFISIMPTNTALKARGGEGANFETREMLERWGRLHAVRSLLGAVAVVIFLWASI